MKKISLFITILFFAFCISVNAQNKKDSIKLIRANATMNDGDYNRALIILEKLSISGKHTSNFLICRAACFENTLKYRSVKTDYDSLFTKTGEIKYNLKSANMLLAIKKKYIQDSIRYKCKTCLGTGFYTRVDNCEVCSHGKTGIGSCTTCDGSGNISCRGCQGTGKITKAVSTTTEGGTTINYVESPCYTCNSKGTYLCNNCNGNGTVTPTCSYCHGVGTISKRIVCPLHN
jgi:hypothetical protein